MNTHWTSLTGKYPDEKQCLASFLAWQAAEVVAGVKPANLISVLDRILPCGRNIHTLWEKHGQSVLAGSEIRAVEMQHREGHRLVLIYHPAQLDKVLQKCVVKKTLSRLGYCYESTAEALLCLRGRMGREGFPHEVGFFLGYPVKDVYGYMGLCDLPLVGSGPWRMYGNLDASLATLNRHQAARQAIQEKLSINLNPLLLLRNKQTAVRQPSLS